MDIPTGAIVHGTDDDHRTTAQQLRRALAALVSQTATGEPQSGVFARGNVAFAVTGHPTSMKYMVPAAVACIHRLNQGIYIQPIPTALEIVTEPADMTNPRVDRVYVVLPDPALSETSHARVDVAVGAPAAIPAVPAIPAGALELGRAMIPAGAVNLANVPITNGPPVIGVNASWDSLAGRPSEFKPVSHTHPAAGISDPENLNVGKVNGVKLTSGAGTGSRPANPSKGDLHARW